MSFTDLRPQLIEALAVDLIGPYQDDEVLRLPPSRWYLTGFLVPRVVREAEEPDPDDDDELAAGNDETEEETAGAEPEPKQKNRLPASMGMSVLLPDGSSDETITATLRFAEYTMAEREGRGEKRKQRVWTRHARPPIDVVVRLDPKEVARGVPVPGYPRRVVKGKLARAEAPGLRPGTRALSLFVFTSGMRARRAGTTSSSCSRSSSPCSSPAGSSRAPTSATSTPTSGTSAWQICSSAIAGSMRSAMACQSRRRRAQTW